jgi:two-component system chemotaxis family response regulator WspR
MSAASSYTTGQEPAFTSSDIRVLLVDDQLVIAEALRQLLADQADIEFHSVADAQLALQTAIDVKPTVILQDLVMPGVDGFELVRQFRANPATHDIPIIILTSKDDSKLKALGFHIGANDYLVKLPDKLEVVARIRYHSAAYINRLQRDDAFRFLRENQQKLHDANIELQKLAVLDGLTGIANRRRFDKVICAEWQRAQREKYPLSLLLCDVDHFKQFNDAYGHPAGDMCLKKVAAVLTENLKRPADLAARYGGKEFALILPNTDKDGALKVAEKCRRQVEALELPNRHSEAPVFTTLSIGLAHMVPSGDRTLEELIDLADRALYRAKESGRNQVHSLP